MQVACIDRYGPPEVIAIRAMPDPVPGPNEVLVRQMASTVSPADCAFRAADPFIVRLFAGLTRPKTPIPGGVLMLLTGLGAMGGMAVIRRRNAAADPALAAA